MIRHYRILLIVIAILISGRSFSQSGYVQGYVITNKGDTLYGDVSDRKGGAFPELYKKVRLKGQGIFIKRFSPNDIKAYRKGNTDFESLWYKPVGSFFREVLISEPNEGDKVFMNVVLKGYLSLYHFEYMDSESMNIDSFPLFKREGQDYFVRVTQGIFGLKEKALLRYFEECEELYALIVDKKIKSPVEIARFYNDNCIHKP